MPQPVVILTDRTGAEIGPLDDASVNQVIWNLNDVGTAEIAVPTMSETGRFIELMKTEFQVWINGTLRWWGYPETVRGDSGLMTYECCDLLGYLKYRFITNTSLVYPSSGTTGVDQVSIMEQVVAQMQAGTFQSFNISSAGVSPSGVVRLRDYDLSSHENALDILKEFPTLNDGCDFSVECIDSFGAPARLFTPWFPSKGSYKPNYPLEWGKNILTFNEFQEDGTKLCTLNYMTGGTDSSGDKIENHYEDTAASEYYAQFQAISTDASELDPAWLLSLAIQTVQNRSKPFASPTYVTVASDGTDLIDNLSIGDTVPVFIDCGRIQIPGDVYRILQATYKGDGTYSLMMGRTPAPFIYPPPAPIL